MARCTECKCCEAQEGFDLCVFCEDGVACPYQQRQAVAPPVPKAVKAETVTVPPRKRRVVNPASPWRGPALLQLKNASTLKAEANSGKKNQKLEKEKTTMPDKTVQKNAISRLCACGCGEPAKSNRSPYIKGHNPNAKRASSQSNKPSRRVARRASPPRKSIATRTKSSPGVATICVTEMNLDNFWAKLSLEEKAALYQQQLESA